jgi:hypothetical protein
MAANEWKRASGPDWLFALALIAAGTAISALSVGEIKANKPDQQLAQATQPSEPQKMDVQPDSTSGTARPTTPAPEPARPDAEAQKQGAQPALPPAPAEKIAPPIKER